MYINLYYLSSNTIHAFFLPPGFHGKSVGENRGRFTQSHHSWLSVGFFFLHLCAGFLYTCLSHTFDIVINNRNAIRLHGISHFPDIRLEARVCPQFFFYVNDKTYNACCFFWDLWYGTHKLWVRYYREFWMINNLHSL